VPQTVAPPSHTLDVLIVGAGPVGLAAAIAARQAGFTWQIVEKGALVNSIVQFPPHMIFFTTPDRLEIGGLPFVSPYDRPTRQEALRYYQRVVEALDLPISLREEVVRVQRQPAGDGESVFAVATRTPEGLEQRYLARAVILAIGYYDHPVRLDVPGEDLPHVSHYYREPHGYFRRPVIVVGGRNSAAEAALDLHAAGARVTLVHRGESLGGIKAWVKPTLEHRIRDGSIATRFGARVIRILASSVVIERGGHAEALPADAVLLLTGYRPNYALLRDAGVRIDEASGVPCYDPETFETTVPALFVAGGVISDNDANPIFIENGRFHGERIVQVLQIRAGRARAMAAPGIDL
jgi:thioredoxin reductase (NADPH)